MKIEKIKGKYYIDIDDETYEISENTIIKYNLTYILNIDEDLKKLIIDDIYFEKNYQNALAYLKKERTEKEIREILDIKYQDQVINKLKEYNFIDDFRYANNYLRQRKELYHEGPKLILKKLNEKGINNDIIELLEYGDEMDNINYLISKTKNNTSVLKYKMKLYQLLINKGYSNELINLALNEISDDDNNLKNDYLKALKKYDDKNKVIKYLYQKGYRYENILEMIRREENEN